MDGFSRSIRARSRRSWNVAGLAVLVLGAVLMTVSQGHAQARPDTTCVSLIGAYKTAQENRLAATAVESARTRMLRCVDTVDTTRRVRAMSLVETDLSRLAGVIMDIPEYHDEGRLPAGNDASGASYLGPMAHIYASPNLGGFTRRAQISEQSKPGLLSAYVVVQLDPGETIPASYARLYLKQGINCIWLYLPDPSPGVRYQAFVSQAAADRSCPNTAQVSGPLEVAEIRDPNFRDEDNYPAAARFDTDNLGQPVLAFKCLDAYCEIGVTPQRVRRPSGVPSNTSGQRRQRVIKGWHDEQILATRGKDNVWRPLGPRATIFPEPNIERLDSADFHQQWRHVATVHVHATLTSGKYFDWGLREKLNQVWLRYDGTRWEAQIRAQGTAQGAWRTWRNVKRTVHYGAAVPGTARFRWTVADDGIWVPCGNACCQADGT